MTIRHTTLILLALFLATDMVHADDDARALAGLWEAQKILLPHLRGNVMVTLEDDTWLAEIAGATARGIVAGNDVRFSFAGDGEVLKLRLDARGGVSAAQWTQAPTYRIGSANISPVALDKTGENRWRGQVTPIEDGFTLHLVLTEREDGSVGAFLRNPDRNLGIFTNLKRVERDGNTLSFIGTFFRGTEEQVFYTGQYDPDYDTFSIRIPHRGGTYDFHRVTGDTSTFYARGKKPPPYRYARPPDIGDGWLTATLDDVDIDLEPLKEMIEREIDPVAQSVHTHDVHGVLIARHGKLVFEEYFHGYHRNWPHDTRSASKSLTSVMVGATAQAGHPVSADMLVYKTILGSGLPGDLDPRKKRMQLEHLLNMTSGFYCDDSDPGAPGGEDRMQSQQEEPDWYRYTLVLPMVGEPGAEGIYCSASSNLVGRVLIAATGESIEDLFQDLIARPLDIDRYHLQLQPTGEPYMGGGFRWLPRDFMKLGQLLIDKGTWRGKRIVSEEWAERSMSPQVTVRDRGYSYAWWIDAYPYRDVTVQSFMAGGNGGQVVIGIPELDLVIAFYGGNYSDKVTYRSQKVLVPEYILKAVR
jgi:CubicO group peptidase (beta-lactamase class C family)